MPPVALTEAQVVILYFFRVDIVSSNRVMSENSSTTWRELRGEHSSEKTEAVFPSMRYRSKSAQSVKFLRQ